MSPTATVTTPSSPKRLVRTFLPQTPLVRRVVEQTPAVVDEQRVVIDRRRAFGVAAVDQQPITAAPKLEVTLICVLMILGEPRARPGKTPKPPTSSNRCA